MLGEDNNFDFNFIETSLNFPFISSDGIIRLPVECVKKSNECVKNKFIIEEYKSLRAGQISVIKTKR